MPCRLGSSSSAYCDDPDKSLNSQLSPPLIQECLLFGSATDNRALAGDINAINVCYDFLLSSLSSGDLGQVRLDSLPFTEDYFVVYNGAVMNAANPYFVFAQQFGLSSVATNGYAPKGKLRATEFLFFQALQSPATHRNY